MAKFTSFDAPQGVAGAMRVRSATASDFGGDGTALKEAGRGIAAFSDMLAKRQEDAAALYREETIADDRLFAATRLQELQDTLPNGGAGAYEILKRELEDRAKNNGDLQTTNTAKGQYQMQSKRLQSDVLTQAVGVEARATAVGERKSFEKVRDFNVNAVRATPTDATLNAGLEQVTRMIDNSRASDELKDALRKDAREDLYAARADGILSTENIKSAADAEAALTRIKTEDFKATLDPKAYNTALDKAQRLVEEYTGQEETAAFESFKETLRERSSGYVDASVDVTDDEINQATSDPKKRLKWKQIARESRQMGDFNKKVMGAGLPQLDVMQKQIIADLEDSMKGDFDFEVQQKSIIDAAIGKAQTAANKARGLANIEDSKIVDSLKDPLTAMAAGGEKVVVTDEELDKIQDIDVRESMYAARDQADQLRRVRTFVADGASEGEIKQQQQLFLAELQDTPGEGFGAAVTRFKAFNEALKLRDERIDADPVAYTIQTNQAVKAAYMAYAEDQSPENFDAMVEAQTYAQMRLDIDPRDVYVLTKAQIGQFTDAKSRLASDPDAPQKLFELIQQKQNEAGKHWPLVMKQLKEQKALTSIEAVEAGMTRDDQMGAALDLLVAASLDKKTLDALAPTKGVADAVSAATTDLRRTLVAGIAGGEQALIEHMDAVSLLTQYYIMGKATPTAAAERAAKVIVMDNYKFSDTYRIPRNVDLSVGVVDNKTRSATQIIDYSTLLIPAGNAGATEGERLTQYKNSILTKGYWVTNGDETGLVLVDEHKNPVLRNDRHRSEIELTWDELRGGGSLAKKLLP